VLRGDVCRLEVPEGVGHEQYGDRFDEQACKHTSLELRALEGPPSNPPEDGGDALYSAVHGGTS
jgi:hypothetical protein